MIYKNFNDHITRKHGVIIEGWPLRTFDNPSAIGSQVELNILLRAWQTGATRFRKMTEVEYLAWMEGRTNPEPLVTPSSSSAVAPPQANDQDPSIVPPSSSSTVVPPQANDQDTSIVPPTNLSETQPSFNVISLESTAALQTSGSAPKKTRKTRSDKGKPRKKRSHVPGAGVFHASTQ